MPTEGRIALVFSLTNLITFVSNYLAIEKREPEEIERRRAERWGTVITLDDLGTMIFVPMSSQENFLGLDYGYIRSAFDRRAYDELVRPAVLVAAEQGRVAWSRPREVRAIEMLNALLSKQKLPTLPRVTALVEDFRPPDFWRAFDGVHQTVAETLTSRAALKGRYRVAG